MEILHTLLRILSVIPICGDEFIDDVGARL